MIELRIGLIRRAATDMELGWHCFYKIRADRIVKTKNLPDDDPETTGPFFNTALNDIRKHPEKYIYIPSPRIGFTHRILNDFIDTVEDPDFQKELADAMNCPDPIGGFYDKLRESWLYFDLCRKYRRQRYVGWVKEQWALLNKAK